MSDGPRTSRIAILGGVMAIAALTHIVLEVDWAQLDPLRAAQAELHGTRGEAHGAPDAEDRDAAPLTRRDRLEALPCFGCHNIDRYMSETRFGHPAHEGAGHCHVCHAFEGHFAVTVREDHCGVCHR